MSGVSKVKRHHIQLYRVLYIDNYISETNREGMLYGVIYGACAAIWGCLGVLGRRLFCKRLPLHRLIVL
jgi:hypothetical protein